jgi:hypothetical protein
VESPFHFSKGSDSSLGGKIRHERLLLFAIQLNQGGFEGFFVFVAAETC